MNNGYITPYTWPFKGTIFGQADNTKSEPLLPHNIV